MRRNADIAHVRAAYTSLEPGGRLVAITSMAAEPGTEKWERAFPKDETPPRVVLSIAMEGRMYRSRGTQAHTRLTVSRLPAAATEARAREEAPAGP